MKKPLGAAIRKRWQQVIVAGIWIALLGAGLAWAFVNGMSIRDISRLIYEFVAANPLAPLIYIVIYALRPLTLFPAMLLTIAAGSLFGFLPGLVYALIGENLSANTAYALARFFRHEDPEQASETRRLSAFRRLLINQAFPTVVVLRASYLPFDLVNYGCGLLRVRWWPYVFASLIGMLPPMITFVSFGASVNLRELLRQDDFSPHGLIDTNQLLISGLLVLASVVIAIWAHRRQQQMVWEAKRGRD